MANKIIFECDTSVCCACGACAMACMDQNDIDIAGGQKPFRTVGEFRTGEINSGMMSSSCHHCNDAPCILACPKNCIYKDPETGLTLYDNTNCIGCKSCAMACPYGAPSFRTSDGKMVKCDGCIERIKRGMDPACVGRCSLGALTWRWAETDALDEKEQFFPNVK